MMAQNGVQNVIIKEPLFGEAEYPLSQSLIETSKRGRYSTCVRIAL